MGNRQVPGVQGSGSSNYLTKLQANERLCPKPKHEKVAKNQHWGLTCDLQVYEYTPRQACMNTHTPKHACTNMCECARLPPPSLLLKNVKISVRNYS